MRDLIKLFLFGIALFFAPYAVGAEKYTVLVLPDNIVTEDSAIDSYIYNQTSEFFANEIINLLNQTDYIKSPTVSNERALLKTSPTYIIPARDLTNKFRTTYNVDYPKLSKIAKASKSRYVLLLTSSIDAENYILRRTLWDFLNIAGATVIDPAYKINTYAVLIDTSNNDVLWSNTFYKTISVVENRIITRGPSPQTEQLQKIRDYSRMICPEIAQSVQLGVLSSSEYARETHKIYYDMANLDNVFTKKYRRYKKMVTKKRKSSKTKVNSGVDYSKGSYNQIQPQKQVKKEVQAEIKKQEKSIKQIEAKKTGNVKSKSSTKIIQPLDFEDESLFDPVYIKKNRKNNLYGEYDVKRPALRDYDNL